MSYEPAPRTTGVHRTRPPSGAPGWLPGYGPGEPHWQGDEDFPFDEPLLFAHDRTEPPPVEITRTVAVR
ncbi:hypothetical protein ETD86_04345 [Nonomuraea turkmeniaca]|uniref:Uncharacterized protein n=1 Tax=Nonomuraea turkmeniaca TaxID=103838 RepID=A0A5S4FV55_9ACTN|nr:hypothetical protein [Nonomuraea turkmeniaca]TMR24579.1 hypothetical protein ETD86_04345 [Nonomuraea turkmeniaca]